MEIENLSTAFDRKAQAALFDAIADKIRRDGYAVIPNALPSELADALLRQLQSLRAQDFSKAGIGRRDRHRRNDFVRRDRICWIEGSNRAEQLWLQWMAELKDYLNQTLLLGLFSFESHYAHYPVGAFYKKHRDAFRGQANRILSVVTYLNPGWLPDDGGELLMYAGDDASTTSMDSGEEALVKVTPAFGTLAVFLSEEFPHEVLPAKRPRYSIAGWYRVNNSTALRIDPPR